MTNYKDFLNEQLQNEEFKKEYDALESEFSIIQAMLENGNANPSLRTLQRLADGMGMKLKLEFVPTNR